MSVRDDANGTEVMGTESNFNFNGFGFGQFIEKKDPKTSQKPIFIECIMKKILQ